MEARVLYLQVQHTAAGGVDGGWTTIPIGVVFAISVVVAAPPATSASGSHSDAAALTLAVVAPVFFRSDQDGTSTLTDTTLPALNRF